MNSATIIIRHVLFCGYHPCVCLGMDQPWKFKGESAVAAILPSHMEGELLYLSIFSLLACVAFLA